MLVVVERYIIELSEPRDTLNVVFPDEALRKTPDPRKSARWLAREFLRTEIANGADFRSGRWVLELSSGAKVGYSVQAPAL